MKKATFHKRHDTKQMVELAGHTIFWRPPYSPAFNPIDHASIAFVMGVGEAVLRYFFA